MYISINLLYNTYVDEDRMKVRVKKRFIFMCNTYPTAICNLLKKRIYILSRTIEREKKKTNLMLPTHNYIH